MVTRRNFLGLAGAALLAPFVPMAPSDICAATAPSLGSSLTTFDSLLKAYYTDSVVKSLAYKDHFVWRRVA